MDSEKYIVCLFHVQLVCLVRLGLSWFESYVSVGIMFLCLSYFRLVCDRVR